MKQDTVACRLVCRVVNSDAIRVTVELRIQLFFHVMELLDHQG